MPAMRGSQLLGALALVIATAAPARAQFPLPSGGIDYGQARFGVTIATPTTPDNSGIAGGVVLTFGGSAARGRRGGLGVRIEAQYLSLQRPTQFAMAGRDTLSGPVLLLGSELGGRVADDVLVYATLGTGISQLRVRGPNRPTDAGQSSGLTLGVAFGARLFNSAFLEWGLLTAAGSSPLLLKAGVLF